VSTAEAAVADAGPLIHLDELDVLPILQRYRRVWVPRRVAREVEDHRPGWRLRMPPGISRVVSVPEADRARLRARLSTLLDPGEVEALAFWVDHPETVVLCDDLEARLAASGLGASVIGTLGLLLLAAREDVLTVSAALELVRCIPERTTLHIRGSLVAEAVARLEQLLGPKP
jgi:predicted nucleic acid-binding protein